MTHTYATYKRPTSGQKPTQTESEDLETNFPSKWIGKKARVAILISDKNRLQKKGHKERPRKSLHNTEWKNTSRRHKHCKYICTQHRSTQIHNENLGGLQERY